MAARPTLQMVKIETVALTVRWLAKEWPGQDNSSRGADMKELQLILCTGERMSNVIERLYRKLDFHVTTFLPQHSKGLGNEFRCYANFDCLNWRRV